MIDAHPALQTLTDALAERDALSAANIELQAQLDTANATIASLTDPWAKIDNTGATDVTAAFQAAMDATGKVPAGTYLIDAVAGLTARGTVTLDPAAVLKVKPNGATHYTVLTVEADAVVSGGQILGDRLAHDYAIAGTHEWGYGVKVTGDRAKVSDMRISQCTGDGIIVSADDVTLTRVVSTQNRRQGLSVFTVKRLKCVECEFSETGALGTNPGTAPQAGVDIEPDSGAAEDIEFTNCTFRDNATSNLLLWTRSGTTASVTSVRVVGGSMWGAPNGVNARSNNGNTITASITGCAIKRGSGSGIRADVGSQIAVNGNTFSTPTDRADFTLTGQDTRTKYDISTLNGDGGVVSVGTNDYR